MNVLDNAIKAADFDSSAVHDTAKYLWQWISPSMEPQRTICGQLMRESGAKTKEEAKKYALTKYEDEIKKFYDALKRDVNKMLEDGYKDGLKFGKDFLSK